VPAECLYNVNFLSKPRLEALDFHFNGLAFSFAALCEPGAQALCEALGRQAEACLHLPFADGQRVVKLRGVGEISHTKLIEPLLRAGASLPAYHHVYFEFLRVHGIILRKYWPFPRVRRR
jgi:hypothetical protein